MTVPTCPPARGKCDSYEKHCANRAWRHWRSNGRKMARQRLSARRLQSQPHQSCGARGDRRPRLLDAARSGRGSGFRHCHGRRGRRLARGLARVRRRPRRHKTRYGRDRHEHDLARLGTRTCRPCFGRRRHVSRRACRRWSGGRRQRNAFDLRRRAGRRSRNGAACPFDDKRAVRTSGTRRRRRDLETSSTT